MFSRSLSTFIIYNAPFVFWVIWKILGPMLDPVVRAKVQFLSKEEELKVHIPPEHLVKKLGGTGEWVRGGSAESEPNVMSIG